MMYKYSKFEQSAIDIVFSSVKLSLLSLPKCFKSILFGSVYFLILFVQRSMLHLDKSNFLQLTIGILLDIIIFTPVIMTYFLELQAYVDNVYYTLIDLVKIISKKILHVILLQVTAFLVVLFAANLHPVIVPFIIFPFFIMVPVIIFKSDNVIGALKTSWRYTRGNRFFILYTMFISLCCYKVFNLYILYLTDINIIIILAFALTLSIFAAITLNLLHNLILRCQNSSKSNA